MQLEGDDTCPATKPCWGAAVPKFPHNEAKQGSAASISSTPCWRGPRMPLPHSPGYEPPFWELPVHSILQIADAGLDVEKNGC